MRILLIQQNFPGQDKHLGPALDARGDKVVALTPKTTKPARWKGVDVLPYKISRGNGKAGHPWPLDLKTICLPKHLSWENDLAAMPLSQTQNGMR